MVFTALPTTSGWYWVSINLKLIQASCAAFSYSILISKSAQLYAASAVLVLATWHFLIVICEIYFNTNGYFLYITLLQDPFSLFSSSFFWRALAFFRAEAMALFFWLEVEGGRGNLGSDIQDFQQLGPPPPLPHSSLDPPPAQFRGDDMGRGGRGFHLIRPDIRKQQMVTELKDMISALG